MPKTKGLEEFFIDELKDLYSAENQITKALPKMAKTANAEELQAGFQEHLKQTENQIKRLEKISKQLGKPLKGKKCKGMEGLLEEGKEIMEEDLEPNVLDMALITAAQKVEHYEISAYGSARSLAMRLGLDDIADILNETLQEEGDTDKKLTKIAEELEIEVTEAE
jgi:ferritin-like metal-binding protein YciE